jgi:hypothetical protein
MKSRLNVNTKSVVKITTLILAFACSLTPLRLIAEDIDIFSAANTSTAENPNVLIVLDNTSNWSRQSQKWPGGLQQGQSEVNAIINTINGLDDKINVGLMEYVTGGNANDNGGFIRSAIRPMTSANKSSLVAQLTTVYNNINSPNEKRNSNTPYGNLAYDVYNYFAGANSYSPNGVVASIADSLGYTTNYVKFKSPLTSLNSCAKTYVIFIGNSDSSGPATDSAANTALLAALGGNTTQLSVPNFTTSVVPVADNLGYTSQCYSSGSTATTTDYTSQCAGYTSCSVNGADSTTGLPTCSSGVRYSVTGTGATSTTSSTTTSSSTQTGTSAACYSSASACTTAVDKGGMTCPANPAPSSSTSGNTTTTTTVSHSCSYACGATTADSCSSTSTGPTVGAASTTTGCSTTTGSNSSSINTTNDHGGLTCPSSTTSTSGNTTTTTTYTCTYAAANPSCGGSGSNKKFTITQTATPRVSTTTINNKFTVTKTDNTSTNVTTSTTGQTVNFGNTFACYASQGSCQTSDYSSQCSGASCVCGSPTTTNGSCPSGARYQVQGIVNTTVVTPTNTYSVQNGFNLDEWAQFFRQSGVVVPGVGTRTITTYAIDVFNAQQSAAQTSLLLSTAKVGGGKYFSATNEAAITNSLKQIFAEIQSVNTAFASASLPVNATNRTQNENQVFIGMFRPDSQSYPRWFGNLKRYQLIDTGSSIALGDSTGVSAVNIQTGFLTDCAISYWTTDSGTYWSTVSTNPTPSGKCPTTASNRFSDSPDGPFVEKGAAAEVIRKGNNPPTTDTTPTFALNRNIYTDSGNSLVNITTATTGLSQNEVDFIIGKDVNDENSNGNFTEVRPSVHGDVIHSRPLPINYGTSTGVTVFYGANDGTLRAVDARTGKERWAFIAPEKFSTLPRLKANSPQISYPGITAGISPTPTAKDYYFDGSIGVYQNSDNSKVWIFATMRRGGRKIYAFDVTDPNVPVLKWSAGCPNLTNDTGCSTGMSSIGQTWAIPNVALIKGYSTTDPVIIMGGGYDACEDANSSSPSCGSTKGNAVYVLNANTGALIKSFATTRSVAAGVSLIDVNNDGLVDYAYAADTGGNIYRLDFVNSGTYSERDSTLWVSNRVAYTNGAGRKFLFGPGLFQNGSKVYLAIGSGDREHPLQSQYPYGNVTNRFYVYVDDLASTATNNMDDPTIFADYSTGSSCNTPAILPGSAKKGWFKSFNQRTGEQTVTSALIAAGLVTFSTNRPVPPDPNSCSTNLGEARGYLVDLLNGSGAIGVGGSCGGSDSSIFVGGGLPPSPVLATVPINGVLRTVIIGAVQKDGSASSPIDSQKIRPSINSRRKRVFRYKVQDN